MTALARYAGSEAWAVIRSGPLRTTLAVGLIAIALFVPALGLLLARNLARLAGKPGEAPALVLTIETGASARSIAEELARDPRIRQVRIVGPEAARERFARTYPDLAPTLSELGTAPFPTTLEVFVTAGTLQAARNDVARAARQVPGVEDVESDVNFDARFQDALGVARAAGLMLGAILIVAAVFSVASAIRLALDHHRDEIEIMRLMGATEIAIRSPFWLYGALEGVAGGGIALGLLYGAFRAAQVYLTRNPHPLLSVFWQTFLSPAESAAIPAIGALAGFVGAFLSVGKAKV